MWHLMSGKADESRRRRVHQRIRRRLSWFRVGSTAFEGAFPAEFSRLPKGTPPLYFCPICLHGFPIEGASDGRLTEEHAPPESLKGRGICLTCKRCNDEAGSGLDSHMLRAENPIAVLRGERPDQSHLIRFRINDEPGIRGTLKVRSDGTMRLEGQPRHTHPEHIMRLQATMQQLVASGSTDWKVHFDFDRDTHDTLRARVGWLRAGYLVAFAYFGYRYALAPALNRVRDQIRQFQNEQIPAFKLMDPHAHPDRRLLGVAAEPIRCIAVAMGRHTILLPEPTDETFYERLSVLRTAAGDRATSFSGVHLLDWPRRPMHVLDFHKQMGSPTGEESA